MNRYHLACLPAAACLFTAACVTDVSEDVSPVSEEAAPTQNFEPAFVTNLGGSARGSSEGEMDVFALATGGYAVIWDRHSGPEYLLLDEAGAIVSREAFETAGERYDRWEVAREPYRVGDDIFLEDWRRVKHFDLATGRSDWALTDARGLMQRRGGLFRRATPCPGPQTLFRIDPADGSERELLTWEIAVDEHPTRRLAYLETARVSPADNAGAESTDELLLVGFEEEAPSDYEGDASAPTYTLSLTSFTLPDVRATWTRDFAPTSRERQIERVAVVDDIAVVLVSDTLYGIRLQTGESAWVTTADDLGLDYVHVEDGRELGGGRVLLSGSYGEHHVILDALTGKSHGRLPLGRHEHLADVAVAQGGRVALALRGGHVQLLGANLATVREPLDPLGAIRYPSAVQLFYDGAHDRLLMHDAGFLYAVDGIGE